MNNDKVLSSYTGQTASGKDLCKVFTAIPFFFEVEKRTIPKIEDRKPGLLTVGLPILERYVSQHFEPKEHY